MTFVNMADNSTQPRGGTLTGHEGESIEALVVALAMKDGSCSQEDGRCGSRDCAISTNCCRQKTLHIYTTTF